MTPQKYPQNLHTQKIFIFLKTRKKPELQNFEPQKNYPRLRMYDPPPPPRATVFKNMTPNIIISSIFDENSHAIKKKSCCKITTVTGPTGYAQSSVMSSCIR